MFCSVCGSQSAPGLKFCKACGARMADDKNEVRNSVAKTFATATVLTGAFGIIGFMIMIKSFLENGGFNSSFILLMSVVYLGSLGFLNWFLVRQVLKLTGIKADERETRMDEMRQFIPPEKARLEEYREPASSVVDNTTRDLNKIAVERD